MKKKYYDAFFGETKVNSIPIFARPDQIESFILIRYGERYTFKECEHTNVDDLSFTEDQCTDKNGGVLFSYYQDDESLEMVIVNEDDESKNQHVQIKHFLNFYHFKPLAICEDCNGEGVYLDTDIYCQKPASSCCGGCEKQYPCDCKKVIFKLD